MSNDINIEVLQEFFDKAVANKPISNEEAQKYGKELMKIDGLAEILRLFTLNDKEFAIISPLVSEKLEVYFNDFNTRTQLLQFFATIGVDITNESTISKTREILDTLELKLKDNPLFSKQKIDFMRNIFEMLVNSMENTKGISKRVINIPIEICNENAKIPTYAHPTDAGMDIYAVDDIEILPGEQKIVPTGIKVAIPNGYALLVHPRSGLSARTKLRVCNSIGLIDSPYRNEIGVILENTDSPIKDMEYHFDENGKVIIDSILHGSPINIKKGERFAQLRLVEVPKASFYQVNNILEFSGDRGGGFGSTDKKE